MQVNLELYRVFKAVASAGSFSRAANELFITQSAVSQSIIQLEGGLGQRLFTRGRGGASLTPAGATLLEHVTTALGLIAAGEERIEKLRRLQEGELSIGASDTISEHYLLPYLETFHNNCPKIKIRVINRTSMQAVALLKSGRIDLALVNLPLQEQELSVTECLRVNDIFVASQKYAYLRQRPQTPAELAKSHLIMLETLSNSRLYVDAFFLKQGVRLEPEIELGAHDLLLEFARIGLGVACVTKQFCKKYLESGELFEVPLKAPVPPRYVGLCALAGVTPSPAAQAFTALLPALQDT